MYDPTDEARDADVDRRREVYDEMLADLDRQDPFAGLPGYEPAPLTDPKGVELLDLGGCPSTQHERRSGGFNPRGTIVRTCCQPRGHDGNHRDPLGFEWTDRSPGVLR